MKSSKRKKAARRVRRSSTEVRARVLAAATELFAENGYAAVTTQQIARRAQVVEPTLFRHFGSKAALLEHAFIEPFAAFIDDFLRRWEQGEAEPTMAARGLEFVERTFDLLSTHREVLKVLLSAKEAGIGQHLAGVLDRLFVRLQRMVQANLAPFEKETAATRERHYLRVRFTFALIAATALFDDWLFVASKSHPKRKALVRALTDYVLADYSSEELRAERKRKRPPRHR